MPVPAHRDDGATLWARIKEQPRPALLIDAAAGLLRDANAAAATLWSVAPLALPLRLDAAMPALQTLRTLQTTADKTLRVSLCFWTARGPLVRSGATQSLGDGLHVAVLLDDTQVVAPRDATAAPQPSSVRAGGHAKLAHELRTPIGAVAAYAEVLAGEHFGPLGSDRYREYAHNMRESALHALAVIEGMMGVTREEAGARRELRFRDVDPAEVIQSCVTVIRPIAEAAEVRLQVCVPEVLPRIIADEVSLRQMLLNLLTNAVKFARPADSVALGVTYGDDGSLTFAVDDTGPGIAETRQAAAGAAAKGLGLGLPLTRELAEANGAALAIESAPGHGTRARISFSHTRVVV